MADQCVRLTADGHLALSRMTHPGAHRVLHYLCSIADPHTATAEVSQATISHDMRLGPNSVSKAVQCLEDEGVVRRDRQPGACTVYTIVGAERCR